MGGRSAAAQTAESWNRWAAGAWVCFWLDGTFHSQELRAVFKQ